LTRMKLQLGHKTGLLSVQQIRAPSARSEKWVPFAYTLTCLSSA
jgi:hypothetical protein